MENWSNGYVSEIDYTYGYYSELSHTKMQYALVNAGIAPPEVKNACELGFGQGISTNIHATTSNVNWYGTDFNSAQAAFAAELARVSKNGAELYDDSFEAFFKRDDLPNFDFICLHGIWSWVSDRQRKIIIDFINAKLNVGGVVYISYNTLPGWSHVAPLRQLMKQHTNTFGSVGNGIKNNIRDAINFTSKIFESKSAYTESAVNAKVSFDNMKDKDVHYLAHEYFNEDWEPMYYDQVRSLLATAKLEFACSANNADSIDLLNLTADHQNLLSSVSDTNFKETLRDFLLNQNFRKDYWIRGKRSISDFEKHRRLGETKLTLLTDAEKIPFTVNGRIGKAELNQDIYRPIINALGDNKTHTVKSLADRDELKHLKFSTINEAINVLLSTGALAMVVADRPDLKKLKLLNEHLIDLARSKGNLAYLCSGLTGSGLSVDRFKQLFLLALRSDKKTIDELAHFAWDILKSQGQTIVKDNKVLDTEEENLADLKNRAEAFLTDDLTNLKRHHVL